MVSQGNLMRHNIKVARVATVPFFLDHQLKHQFRDLIDYGFDVTAIGSSSGDWSGLEGTQGLECLKIDICRQPSPIRDLISLFRLFRCFKKNKFDVVHSTTPKAGLLCAIAARLARVPVRLHTFTGQIWATRKGPSKSLLRLFDKVIVRLNTRCYADSFSQRAYLNSHGVGNEVSIRVLGDGALAGVDLERFNTARWSASKKDLMAELDISSDDFVIIFIGRLSRDKGIYELLQSVQALSERHGNIKLLLVGPCEEPALSDYLQSWIKEPFIKHIGETNSPERYLAVSHVLCLPSYREGFGTVVIEAAAMKLPTIGSKITGLIDAVEDGVTGVLIEPANSEKLRMELERFIEDPAECNAMGEHAYKRCQALFDSKKISQYVQAEYFVLMREKENNAKDIGHRS
jgi:glycosyltransferase involved in cell wall biosynthesis